MTGVEIALLAASVAISAAGAIQAGKAQADAQRFNAKLARQQAEREREIAGQQAADFRRKAGRRLASARTLRAGSGTTVEGTPLLVQEASAADAELGARRIEVSGASAAARQESRANLLNTKAKNTLRATAFKAGSTLLTGASQIAGAFATPAKPEVVPTVPADRVGPGGFLAGPV